LIAAFVARYQGGRPGVGERSFGGLDVIIREFRRLFGCSANAPRGGRSRSDGLANHAALENHRGPDTGKTRGVLAVAAMSQAAASRSSRSTASLKLSRGLFVLPLRNKLHPLRDYWQYWAQRFREKTSAPEMLTLDGPGAITSGETRNKPSVSLLGKYYHSFHAR
jgi:hypothetical protein